MKTRTRQRTSAAILFVVVLMAAFFAFSPLTVYAGVNGTVSEGDLYPQDTPHGHYFYVGNYRLNQWGNSPVSGTRVTTWSNTGDITQAWDVRYTRTGHWIVTTNAQRHLGLNIYRSGSNPEVNVIPYIGNDFNDCVVTAPPVLRLAYAKSPYTNFGVTIMYNEYTSPSNTYGRICRWTASPTSWSHQA